MTPQERIADAKAKLETAEAKHPGCPKLRALHNSLAAGLAEHGAALGLTEGEIVAFGGGTNKDDPEG